MGTLAEAREKITRHLLQRGTELPADLVRERLATVYRDFDACLAVLDEKAATLEPDDGGWSVRDVVDHLLESERGGLDEIRCVVAGERPPGPPLAASLRSPTPRHRPWPWLVREMAQAHADVVDACAAGGEHRPGEATAEIVIVVYGDDEAGEPGEAEWVVEADWRAYAACLRVHTIEHLNQIREVLAAQTGGGAGSSSGG